MSEYDEWKANIVIDRDILGGNPVFPNSRLSVFHIAAMVNRGVATEEILEDYPYLTKQDLIFADRFTNEFLAV